MKSDRSILEKNQNVFICLGISILTSFTLLFFIILFSVLNISTNNLNMLWNLTLPTFVSLYLISSICVLFFNKPQKICIFKFLVDKSYILFIVLLIIFLSLYIYLYNNLFENTTILVSIIFHYLVVSIGEEYIYRGLILKILRKNIKYLLVF